MSTLRIRRTIRNNALYKGGERIRMGDVEAMCKNKSTPEQYRLALMEMVRNGEIKAVEGGWKKVNTAGDLLRRAWRKRSDFQLGIVA